MSWNAVQFGVGILYSLQVGWKPVSKISASYEPNAHPPDNKLMYADGQNCSHWQSTITEKISRRCHYVLNKFCVDPLGEGGYEPAQWQASDRPAN
jgi:hypothetical protein